jgi:hypothetical protein
MLVSSVTLPAYKLVLCFLREEDRQLWMDALSWAEKRFTTVKQHDDFAIADKQAAQAELEELERKSAQHRKLLQDQLAEAQRAAEASRLRQEELYAAKQEMLAETDRVKQAAAAERLRLIEERDQLERAAEEERQRILKERQAFEAFEAKQKSEQEKLLSQQEELKKSLKPLKTFTEK